MAPLRQAEEVFAKVAETEALEHGTTQTPGYSLTNSELDTVTYADLKQEMQYVVAGIAAGSLKPMNIASDSEYLSDEQFSRTKTSTDSNMTFSSTLTKSKEAGFADKLAAWRERNLKAAETPSNHGAEP